MAVHHAGEHGNSPWRKLQKKCESTSFLLVTNSMASHTTNCPASAIRGRTSTVHHNIDNVRSNVERLTISLSQESLQSKNMLARPYATLVRRTCARVPRVARSKVNLPFLERNCARGNVEPVRLSPDAQRIDIVAASQTLLDCSQRFMHFLGRSVLLYAFGHHLLVLLQGVLSWTINFRIALSNRIGSKTVFFGRNLHILQGTCNFGRRKSWQIINLSSHATLAARFKMYPICDLYL